MRNRSVRQVVQIGVAAISLTPLAALSATPQVAAGEEHVVALKSDGTIWAWGSNHFGQLGIGSAGDASTVPVQVSGLTGVVAVAAGGGFHSLALKSDGSVWAWGGNLSGELGNGTTVDSHVPVQVVGLPNDVVAVAAGYRYSLALKSDGTVWAWGGNYFGELGNGSTVDSPVPVQVSGLTGVIAVARGGGEEVGLSTHSR